MLFISIYHHTFLINIKSLLIMDMQLEFEPINFAFAPVENQPQNPSESEDYDDLYLLLGMGDQNDSPICQRKNSSKEHSDNQEETNITKTKCSQSSKVSAHHNFQKHTVTALKSMIKVGEFDTYFSETKVMTELWKTFLKNKNKSIQTKKFLYVLFNSASSQELRKYGFEKLFAQFEETQIQQAQDQLRELTLRTMSHRAISEHVENRKLERKQNFLQYLLSFRQELESKQMKKRMNKDTADKIAKSIDIFSCLDLTF